VCTYKLVVCSPLLCNDKTEEEAEADRVAQEEFPNMDRQIAQRLRRKGNMTLSQVSTMTTGTLDSPALCRAVLPCAVLCSVF
jgi:hypothetical protein